MSVLEVEAKNNPTPHPRPSPVGLRVHTHGHDFELLPSRAAYWPAQRTLLVADLHLGKSETFQRAGVPMPSGAMVESLDRLGRLIADTGATRVLVLGDLLHAPAGITPSMVDTVSAWRARVSARIQVVSGNHDRDIDRVAKEWGIDLLGESRHEFGVVFVHNPDSAHGRQGFVWAGHVHPAVIIGHGRARMKLACFVLHERGGILPAFSLFTAGATVGARYGGRVFACAGDEVVEFRSIAQK